MTRAAGWVVLGLALGSVGALGCDRGAPERAASEPAASAPPAAAASPSAPTAAAPVSAEPGPAPAPSAFAPPARAKTTGVSEQKRDGMPALLHAVRAARNDGHDRVVFEFRERIPGYHLEYVSQPIVDCGAGDEKRVAGNAHLEARFYPASAHTEQGQPTVPQRELEPALPVVRELERTCDFEAVVTWVIGTTSRKPYSVLELADPPRLVIDIEH